MKTKLLSLSVYFLKCAAYHYLPDPLEGTNETPAFDKDVINDIQARYQLSTGNETVRNPFRRVAWKTAHVYTMSKKESRTQKRGSERRQSTKMSLSVAGKSQRASICHVKNEDEAGKDKRNANDPLLGSIREK